jgi:hypothetical protein
VRRVLIDVQRQRRRTRERIDRGIVRDRILVAGIGENYSFR